MAIVNRDGDASEQKEWITWVSGPASGVSYGLGVGVGVTIVLAGPIPYPYSIQSCAALALGMSGAPQLAFSILRPGNGNTVIAIGLSNMVVSNGFSLAPVGYSGLAAQGSTLLLGQRNDILLATTVGANTAFTNLVVNVVVKKTQDIVSHNGISS